MFNQQQYKMHQSINPIARQHGVIERHDATETGLYPLYNNPLLDICSENGLIGLALSGTYNKLFDFIGLEASNVDNKTIQSLTYMGVEGTAAGTATLPWQADPCDDRASSEWGSCALNFNGFGRLSLRTPVRDITQAAIKKCEIQPEYFYDGARVTDELQWDFIHTSKSLFSSLHNALIVGNKSSGDEQFDGLQRLIKTGYVDTETGEVCSSLDSNVIDYNEQSMCPPTASPTAGITWNGNAVPGGTTLIQIVEEVIHVTMQRAAMSSYGDLNSGNVVIVMPNSWISEFLDCYTCAKYCTDGIGMDSKDAREYRESLNGGLFNAGSIRVANLIVPIIGYDHSLINASGTADMYILTNKIGQQPLIRMEYNDFRRVVNAGGGVTSRPQLFALDDGKLLVMPSGNAGTCDSFILELQPRLIVRAPWAQTRIQDVARSAISPTISGDSSSTFYIESNLVSSIATTTTTTTTTTAP